MITTLNLIGNSNKRSDKFSFSASNPKTHILKSTPTNRMMVFHQIWIFFLKTNHLSSKHSHSQTIGKVYLHIINKGKFWKPYSVRKIWKIKKMLKVLKLKVKILLNQAVLKDNQVSKYIKNCLIVWVIMMKEKPKCTKNKIFCILRPNLKKKSSLKVVTSIVIKNLEGKTNHR